MEGSREGTMAAISAVIDGGGGDSNVPSGAAFSDDDDDEVAAYGAAFSDGEDEEEADRNEGGGDVDKREGNEDDDVDDDDDGDNMGIGRPEDAILSPGGGVSLDAIKRSVLGRKIQIANNVLYLDNDDSATTDDTKMTGEWGTKNGIQGGGIAFDSSLTKEELKSEVGCAICQEVLYRPVSLGCGHSFCAECLEWWAERSGSAYDDNSRRGALASGRTERGNSRFRTCPTCRTELSIHVGALRINSALRACVTALFREENARLASERRAKLRKRIAGENGERHGRGYEVVSPIGGEWNKVRCGADG